ncbi:MAG: FecR domain-containing protein [Deltaproteobacteria bacterium]|nr:FecR domain-containing protein [Deltaproteobacteria bacterium]
MDGRTIPSTVCGNNTGGRRTRKGVLHLLLAVAMVAILADASWADTAGTIAYVQGKVGIMKEGMRGAFTEAKVGDDVTAGDVIKTGLGAKAQINLNDASTIYIAPGTQMQVKQFIVDREHDQRTVKLAGTEGRLRLVVSKVVKASMTGEEGKWKDSNFTIETPTAVAGIQGTVVVFTFSKSHTTASVIEGLVKFAPIGKLSQNFVVLSANNASTIFNDKKPTTPTNLTPDIKNYLIYDTMPIFEVEKVEKGEETVTKEQIDADTQKTEAALKVISESLTKDKAQGEAADALVGKAIESGLDTGETVKALIDAGVDPKSVVFAAIDKGLSPKGVNKAALEKGVPVKDVVKAAKKVGASDEDIQEAAKDAGVPPEIVAKYIADTSADTKPFTPAEKPPVDSAVTKPIVGIPVGGGAASKKCAASEVSPDCE